MLCPFKYVVIAVALLLLAGNLTETASADQVTSSLSAPGEEWVDKTRKTLHKTTGTIGVGDMIKIGAPAYYHIRGLAERGESFNIFPELVAGELSKVAEYGGVKPKFDSKGERSAKRTLIKAASYLPADVVRRIPAVEARTVIGRGRFRQYDSGRAVIKTNGVRLSLHELAHAFEYSDHHLLRLRKEFYDERTRGKKLRNLHFFLFPFGYGPDEKYKEGFVDRYMGKEGGVEVYSCGVEYVFFNRRSIWHRDPEATKFILGSLIFYGNHISSGF